MITFDEQVAIVTGAGHGLGRAHALALAERGARVVVNDLGGSRDGTGASSDAAKAVVAEIEATGGEAMANGADVTDESAVKSMVDAAVDRWGRVDILINNAGILRDKSFAKMELADFALVVNVHLRGTAICTKAVWNIMREQNYGRIVVTTSSSGLYGNFGQANYGAAKLGVVGFMNTLRAEGANYDIRVNALSPVAHTRMTDELLPDEAKELLKPEEVTPGVMFLVSKDAPNGVVLAAGAGGFASARIFETDGIWLSPEERTPENIAARFDEIRDPEGHQEFTTGGEQTMKFLQKAMAGLQDED
ncbi:MAG: SDR family NAD(P)-dependent oxidoreductase [Acidimicrobiia bacterium]|nr:MAG: SDR family NAD(P)-dependent oxidoreductase [Acidimicrobiia bacterium]